MVTKSIKRTVEGSHDTLSLTIYKREDEMSRKKRRETEQPERRM